MAEIPAVEQDQLIEYLADIVSAALSSAACAVEFNRGEAGLVIKSNGGPYKQKQYINGTVGDFTGEFSFMVMNTVLSTDGKASVLLGTKPLEDLADYFGELTKAELLALEIGDEREPVKIEMTSRPQDQAGVQENGSITFFAVYTLTYRKKGA
jgi:hypothetical protein